MRRSFWWIRHSRNTLTQLTEEEEKRNKRREWIVNSVIVAIVAALLVGALFPGMAYLFVPACAILLVRSIFWSRVASVRLALYRQKYLTALRQDQPFPASRKYVIGKTVLVSSSFYVFWFATSFLNPLGGFYGWLFTTVASGFLFFVVNKLVIEVWQDLGLPKLLFWSLHIGCWILLTLPGVILSIILY